MEETKMKKLSKILAIVLTVAALCAMMTACSSGAKAAPAEVYTAQFAFVEAGYEGDCVNNTNQTLILNADGSYTYVENFNVNQVSGIVVFFSTTHYTGTYKVDSEADGVKTVTLSAPTAALNNSAGNATTSAEDPSLLEGFAGGTVTCDTGNNSWNLG